MKLTKKQLKRIIKEELQAVMSEEMGESLYRKVMSNIDRISRDESKMKNFEARKYTALLSAIEDSNYDEDDLNDPDMAAGLWILIFSELEDQKWSDGPNEYPITFTKEEVELMCPDCGPIWAEVAGSVEEEIHYFEENERSDAEKDRMGET